MIARVEEPTEWISSCLESGKTKVRVCLDPQDRVSSQGIRSDPNKVLAVGGSNLSIRCQTLFGDVQLSGT